MWANCQVDKKLGLRFLPQQVQVFNMTTACPEFPIFVRLLLDFVDA